MLRLIGLLILAAALYRAWRSRADLDPARIRSGLWRFGLAAVLARLLRALASERLPGPVLELVAIAGGICGAVALAQVFWLAEKKPLARDHWVRAFFLMAGVTAVLSARPSFGGITALWVSACLVWRWRDALRTRELFSTALGGLGLLAVAVATSVHKELPAAVHLSALAQFSWSISRVAWSVSLAYAILGLFPVVAAFLRDPSLGIHTVRRRLALSHVLVLAVPLLITIALWTLTTWLGVGAERAMTGKRLLEREARSLQRELQSALQAPDADAAERQLQRTHERERPQLRLWRSAPGDSIRLVRVAGGSVGGEAALAAWLRGADTLQTNGLVLLARMRYLGALAHDPKRGALLALVPIPEVLDSTSAHLVGAELIMSAQSAAPDSTDETDAGAPPAKEAQTAPNAATKAAPANAGGRLHWSATKHSRQPAVVVYGDRKDTLETSDSAFSNHGIRGMALIHGVLEERGHWKTTEFSLRARVPFAATLTGLYDNVRENPLSIVPIVILTLLVALLLPVALFNFRLVGGLGRSFTQPVAALRKATEALGAGQLEHRVAIEGDDELWQTAAAFNRMAEGLERARSQEQERVRFENELELARRIQARLLPAAPPDVPGLEIAGASESAREVGGDYYDHLVLADGRVLLVIADVSGKGTPAALIMSAFRAALVSQDDTLSELERLAEKLNAFLNRSVESGRFVTAFFGLLDPRDGRLQYVNAGHNPALLLRAGGPPEWLAAGGLILGIVPSTTFERGEATLAKGDLLVLYTDGVTEGVNASAEFFGEDRLVATVRRIGGATCRAAAAELVREVRAYEGDTGPADDITVLLARIVG